MSANCTLISILRGISLCLAFHTIAQPGRLLAQTRVTGSVADDAGGPPPRATLVLRHIPDLPKLKLREKPRLPSIPSFEKIAQIAQGVRAFSVDDVPDGLLHVCAYPEDIAYISNCEFTEPSDTYYKVSKGSLNRPLAIALRRGTIVEIVVSDPRGLISQSSGFHFNPALISSQGQIKPARFRSKLGSELTYLASLPVGTAAKLLVDTRLQVLGADGKRIEPLNPSAIEVRGGQPFVRVTLQVTTNRPGSAADNLAPVTYNDGQGHCGFGLSSPVWGRSRPGGTHPCTAMRRAGSASFRGIDCYVVAL